VHTAARSDVEDNQRGNEEESSQPGTSIRRLKPPTGQAQEHRSSQECQKMKPLLSTKTVIHSSVLLHFTWVIQLLVGQSCITKNTWIPAKGTS